MNAHTPSPWRIAPAGLYLSGINIDSVSVKQYVCLVSGYPSDDRAKHDAQLIAAAPEMYEFIQICANAGNKQAIKILGEIHANT